jgi:heme-binding NEAT domain protein
MGRFDALTQLDEKPTVQPPLPEAGLRGPEPSRSEQQIKKPESLKTRKNESLKGRKPETLLSGKTESLYSGNQASPKARKPENRKVPKYSTQLEEALQIKVSVYAKLHRMKDYEVVQCAVEEYLNTHHE